jgi:hypothetical protein
LKDLSKKPPKKTKKFLSKQRKTTHRKAWAVFSNWIRQRDRNVCFTCGKKEGTMHAGHFWHGYLDFDEMNINCQCPYCNTFLHGNLGVYARKLIEKYGVEKFDQMAQRRFTTLYFYDDLLKVIKKYS